jgi:hypothetical protein
MSKQYVQTIYWSFKKKTCIALNEKTALHIVRGIKDAAKSFFRQHKYHYWSD